MASYSPGSPPSDQSQMSEIISAIYREFAAVASAINSASDATANAKLAVEPTKPRDGMIVYADGANWDPGSGEGTYAREAGAWVKLG